MWAWLTQWPVSPADRRRLAGYAGVRVGEASHPGPRCRFAQDLIRGASIQCDGCARKCASGHLAYVCPDCGVARCLQCGSASRSNCIAAVPPRSQRAAIARASGTKPSDFQDGVRENATSEAKRRRKKGAARPMHEEEQADEMQVDEDQHWDTDSDRDFAVHPAAASQGQQIAFAHATPVGLQAEGRAEDQPPLPPPIAEVPEQMPAAPAAQPLPIGPPEARAGPPAAAWRAMGALDLEAELRKPVRTMREPPRWFRAMLRQAFMLALRERKHKADAAWKLFILIPRMLLRPTARMGEPGKRDIMERYRRFTAGDWLGLLADVPTQPARRRREETDKAAMNRKSHEAEAKVRMREVRRARHHLTSSGLAPGTPATLAQLTDPNLRPTRLAEPLPEAAVTHVPRHTLTLDWSKLASALRSAGRGSAADLSGSRYEHYRVMLEDKEAWAEFADFLQDFARARVPEDVLQSLRLGRMTALKKKDERVRGIVAGSVIRRLACRAVAQQFADELMETTAPFQFALQARAGTDALARAVQFLTEEDADTTVISLDGIGAFDHVRRAAFMRKMHETEALRPLLPLVTALYGTESRFLWRDDEGESTSSGRQKAASNAIHSCLHSSRWPSTTLSCEQLADCPTPQFCILGRHLRRRCQGESSRSFPDRSTGDRGACRSQDTSRQAQGLVPRRRNSARRLGTAGSRSMDSRQATGAEWHYGARNAGGPG